MIRFRAVAHTLGMFFLFLSVALLVPLALALTGRPDDPLPFVFTLLIAVPSGGLLRTRFARPDGDLSRREGLLLVVLVWVSICFLGSLPFHFSPYFPTFADAFFESVSGFTTTGASVLPEVEVLTQSLQFWRCATHWLGGMGIVLLGIAILPLLGTGGMSLYQAQFGGSQSDKLQPRVMETARALWKTYVALSLAEYLALRWLGMNSFEAICHTFSTMGTGGFSTRTTSIAGFNSPAIEYTIVLFMILASINFTQHYRLWVERRPAAFLSAEVRFHLGIIAVAGALITWSLVQSSAYEPGAAARAALFQVASIITCTGFVTADFEKWQPLPQMILIMLMYIGGNTGSTAGGIKTFRILLLCRTILRETKSMIRRRGVFTIRIDHRAIPETTIQSLLNLVQLVLLFNLCGLALMTAVGVDLLTSITALASTMFGVGPGLGQVGPMEHYGYLPQAAKWILCGSMLAGRLEFYCALVVFTPVFWKR